MPVRVERRAPIPRDFDLSPGSCPHSCPQIRGTRWRRGWPRKILAGCPIDLLYRARRAAEPQIPRKSSSGLRTRCGHRKLQSGLSH
jgi:hypothetical protein